MSSTEYFRTFIAVTPDEPILDALENGVRKLRHSIDAPGIRWESRNKWHITLCFLGDVIVTAIPELSDSLEAVCAEQTVFPSKVEGFGAFPSLKRPRILWAGIDDREKHLSVIQKTVTDASTRFGARKEDKPFRPHLTVARVRTEDHRVLSQIAPAVQPLTHTDFGSWEVASVELWRSTLQSGGSMYELLARFPLQR